MQTIEEILNVIKERNLNVSELARNTGIPGTRIYKWLDGKGMPKLEDSEKLKDWAKKNLDKILKQEVFNFTLNEPVSEYGKQEHNYLAKYIATMERQVSFLERMMETNLTVLADNQSLVLAYQKAWVEFVAEKEAGDDLPKKTEIQYKMGILVGKYLPVRPKGDKGAPDGTESK